jgi:hypothetical protein
MMYRTLLTEKQQKRTSIPTRLPFTQAIADARNSRKLVQEFKKQKNKRLVIIYYQQSKLDHPNNTCMIRSNQTKPNQTKHLTN